MVEIDDVFKLRAHVQALVINELYDAVYTVVVESLEETVGPEPIFDPFGEFPEISKIAKKATTKIIKL